VSMRGKIEPDEGSNHRLFLWYDDLRSHTLRSASPSWYNSLSV
jgi:hypothetical protein